MEFDAIALIRIPLFRFRMILCGSWIATFDSETSVTGIIDVLQVGESTTMEAEHINSISNKLDDLAQRAAELRRYL